MHAASVYPEPGSNSLNMIYQGYLSNHHTEFVCSTYFKELIIFKFKRIFGVFYILSLLFNFQGASRTFWGAALLLYQNLFSLSTLFWKFFQSFFEAFWAFRPCSCRCSSYFVIRFCLPQLSLTTCILYQLIPLLSITFFIFFRLLLF